MNSTLKSVLLTFSIISAGVLDYKKSESIKNILSIHNLSLYGDKCYLQLDL